MDIYQLTTEYLLALPIFDAWEEMKTILQRAASLRPRDWQLPVLACQALGESVERAVPASAGLACAQISIILVDDMLDDDPRGKYHQIGSGRASNFALAFQSAGTDALITSSSSSSVRQEALNTLNCMMLTTAHGQELDVQNPEDEVSYWRVVENKSAPFYGCALHLGALFAEAREETAQNLEQLGRIYGEMIQLHDDLNDTMAVPANPDWLQKRKPLPILFALTVEHPDQTRFMELYDNVSVWNALQEAQEILIHCGAVSYCVDQLIRRHQIAQELLNKTQLANKEILDSLLGGVIAPVWKLFESLGLSSRALPTVTSAPSQE
ncbi:MAG TPA: polyprenyl synthetase family protein [Anaerolineales bacterium]|nr:polyprenyl synthetase family protein [Anaerolineales bacterium]